MKYLFRKRDKPSKTASWLTWVMMPTVLFLWTVMIRMVFIKDELFIEALIGGAAFFTLITFLVGRLYHKGKVLDNGRGDEEDKP